MSDVFQDRDHGQRLHRSGVSEELGDGLRCGLALLGHVAPLVVALLLCACKSTSQPTTTTSPPLAPPAVPSQTTSPPPVMDAAVDDSDDLSINQEGGDLAKWLTLSDSIAGDVKYAHLKKNPERHRGTPWSFSGRIVEITELQSGTAARVSLDAYGNNIVFVVAQFTTDFVEDDGVDVLGTLMGTYSYESQAGWNITIPSILARSIQKRGTLAQIRRTTRKAAR